MSDKPQNPVSGLSFEQAVKELEEIVNKLERGDASLEDSIAIYQRGAALKAHCEGLLKAAQLKVDKIVLDASGDASLETFDSE